MKNLIIFILLVLIFGSPALAHERRVIAGGEFEFFVGFINEPAFSGQMNGVDLRVKSGGQPVEGLETTVKVIVRYGDETAGLEVPFKARYRDPGAYGAYFLPALPGKYVFEISGTVNGRYIREVFESGEKFHDVEDSNAVIWPQQGASPATDTVYYPAPEPVNSQPPEPQPGGDTLINAANPWPVETVPLAPVTAPAQES